MTQHKLAACSSRATFQIEKAAQYLALVSPAIPPAENDVARQFLYQTIVLMVQSYFEEYLRCVVASGSFYKTPEVRLHLAARDKDPERFAVMPMAEVGRHAQGRVSFEDRAGKLKGIIGAIAVCSPFADPDGEEKCLDFNVVRNIIAHRGGWPNDEYAPSVKTPNVILESAVIGTTRFYRLQITSKFLVDGLAAIGRSILGIEEALAADSVFQL
jgi:hypothetical protein